MNIYFDIETIPSQKPTLQQFIIDSLTPPANYKKAESIEQWLEENREIAVNKTALNGTFGEIISIAVALDDEQPRVFYCDDWQNPQREWTILRGFFDYLIEHYQPSHDIPPVFIGHNHVGFDLRFIWQRAIVNGVKPCAFYPVNPRTWDNHVYDTMTEWAGVGKFISMNELCTALGIDGKGDGLDGSQVWDAVQQGRVAEVAQYNIDDVIRTRQIYKRMNFME